MRKIKFRGKLLYIEEWTYGSLIIDESQKIVMIADNESGIASEVDKETVGQYTGLKDKNGKEIYEGDIVKVKLYKGEEEKYFIGKVEYFGSNFIVDADNNSEYHVYDLDGFGIDYRYNLEDCEVIGNIYDNPELLEEGK